MTKVVTKSDKLQLTGSWHPTGFHGHNRANTRIEFSNSFRQCAKPIPPKVFQTRQRDDVLKHVFSKHDNRQIFLNDPNLFGAGFGKRKVTSKNLGKWNPEFIAWKEDAGRDRLKQTIYQNDFGTLPNKALAQAPPRTPSIVSRSAGHPNLINSSATAGPMMNRSNTMVEPSASNKLLPNRYNNGHSEQWSTKQPHQNQPAETSRSYYSHSFEQTSKDSRQLNADRQDTTERFVNLKNRSKSCLNLGGPRQPVNVATCLVWYDKIKQLEPTPQPSLLTMPVPQLQLQHEQT